MKIETNLGVEISMKDLLPGEIFQTEGRRVCMKTAELTVTFPGYTSKVNAISLKDGVPLFFGECVTVFSPNAKLVIG